MKHAIKLFFSQVDWKTAGTTVAATTATGAVALGFYFIKRAIRNHDRLNDIIDKEVRRRMNKQQKRAV